MKETKTLLKEMISTTGLSAFENPIREIIQKAWEPITDQISLSKLGSLHGLKKGSGPEPRPSIMIATHMDAIGMMVSRIDEGFLHITQIGGIDHRVLPGQMVTVTTQGGDIPGMIVQPPNHTLPEDIRKGPIPLNHLIVDTGLRASQTAKKVRVGDLVSFATEPMELKDDYLAGHSLDNRASVAVMTKALELLQKRDHFWDLIAVATVQEETGLIGAFTSGFQLRPTLGLVIDVTHAKSPGANSYETFEMNKGPTLDWGPNTHPKLYKEFETMAKDLEIPTQKSVYHRSSGTDAILLQVTAEGIPTMVMSIPLRYMHTPVEMLHMKDIDRAARLLTEFVSNLDADFMDKLAWEDEKEEE